MTEISEVPNIQFIGNASNITENDGILTVCAVVTGGAVRLLERSRPGVLHNDLNACNEYRHGLETAAKVACPAHLILGREDMMAPPRAAGDLIAALPVVQVTELADCGHMLMAEQPDAVRDALAAAFPGAGG